MVRVNDVLRSDDPPQFCSYCGEELEELKERSSLNEDMLLISLTCPNRKKWWRLKLYRHTKQYVRQEVSDTVLNYDPFTGERIKKNVKSQ